MEMAAKTENRAFINRNLHIFLEQLRGTVKEIKQETKDLPESGHILRQGKLPMMDEEQRRLCWKGLKYGFAAGTGALQQVLSGICRTLLDRRVCAVSAGAPQADTYTGCLHLRATLTYREDLEDGDGEYERTG